jgi:hypothetical protein
MGFWLPFVIDFSTSTADTENQSCTRLLKPASDAKFKRVFLFDKTISIILNNRPMETTRRPKTALYHWRKLYGLTQYGLARKSGVGGSKINKYETRRSIMKPEDAEKFSKLFGIPLNERGMLPYPDEGSSVSPVHVPVVNNIAKY